MVKLLIENGADINHKNDRHETALHYAIERGMKIILFIYQMHSAAKRPDRMTRFYALCRIPVLCSFKKEPNHQFHSAIWKLCLLAIDG